FLLKKSTHHYFPSPPQRRGLGRGLVGGSDNKHKNHLSKVSLTRPLPPPAALCASIAGRSPSPFCKGREIGGKRFLVESVI
ncbi:MAG: hypothetical protein AAB963_01355, partial [Patescibacteria group bacterium]